VRQDFRAGPPASRRGTLAEIEVSKERVAALFDGIVAITATLLILNIDVTTSGPELTLGDLHAILPSIAHWAVSFVMVAVVWSEFHFVFAHSQRWDGGLLLVTFAQIAAISLIPFASDLVGEYSGSVLAALVFSAVMGANGLLVSANLYILQRKTHLHADETAGYRLGRRGYGQILIYALCIPLSLFAAMLGDSTLSVLAWIACPLALAFLRQRFPPAGPVAKTI
jgi:uncharacterized membrane protein